jgi:hypothetical protein
MIGIGSKVVCISDKWDENSPASTIIVTPFLPSKGKIYTIREIVKTGGDFYIRLNEIVNPRVTRFSEPSFWIYLFRPVTETDIDVSTAKEKELELT